MAIKDIYRQAINSLTNEKAQKVEQINEVVMREKVLPHNEEVDKKLAEAIKELKEKLDQNVLTLQNEFNAERQRFVDMADTEKKSFAEKTINAECELVRIEYETAISHIREKLQEDEA